MEARASFGGVAKEPMRVLLVDDHRDTLDVLRRVLEARGYRVTTAESVQSALDIAGATAFDVLISDIGLPDGTGHEIARGIGPIPKIAISGFSSPDDLARSSAAGFYCHLVKPISINRLFGLLDGLRG